MTLEGRNFSLQTLKFNNGYFISVSEGDDKIGSMVVSMLSGSSPITTTIIPSRTESFFLRLIAERLSTMTRGVVLVSSFVQKELERETAKSLMAEIMDMVQDE